MHVDEGEIVSVIGPNGAGKTTLFNLDHRHLRARTRATSSSTGERSSASRRTRSASAGISRTFQTLRLFLNMSVQGERDGGRVRPHAGRRLPVDAADAGHAPRGARDRAARRGAARVLRRAADGLSLGPARVLALVREPAAARDRARHRDESAPAAARRAGGRDEPGRDARDHGADRASSAPRAATRSSSSSTTCTSSRGSPIASSHSTTASRSPRASFEQVATDPAGRRGVPRHRQRRRRSDRPTRRATAAACSGSTPTTARSTSCRTLTIRVERRRARVPARRQRVRQVDDAEDDPRHRAAPKRAP